jgi:hypothetical protein
LTVEGAFIIINAIFNYIIGEYMEKQTWQAPELKELIIENTQGGANPGSMEGTTYFSATSNP